MYVGMESIHTLLTPRIPTITVVSKIKGYMNISMSSQLSSRKPGNSLIYNQ